MKINVRCPAKVNLFLAVGPKDARGYHPLRTIFQAIDLCDTLIVDTDTEETSVACDWSDFPVENTLTKTVRLLSEIVVLPPLAITLEKRIPAQSGLGGGSSDAAGLLKAIKALGLPVAEHQIRDVAAATGADVSFFLMGGKAKGEGYGEKLTPLPDEPTQWLLVAQPHVRCSTVEAYAKLDEFSYEWRNFPATDELYNDFERVAPAECLDLIELMRNKGAKDAALTGSGSAVFGRFSSKDGAYGSLDRIEQLDSAKTWLVRTLDRTES